MISKKTLIIDGIIYKRLELIIKKEYKNHSQLEITLREGKNREIRKIMNYFKLKV